MVSAMREFEIRGARCAGGARRRRALRRRAGDAPPARSRCRPATARSRLLAQDADSGIGVRALVGSGLGVLRRRRTSTTPRYAAAGARAAEIAAASALVGRDDIDAAAGRRGHGLVGQRVPRRPADGLARRTRATCWSGRPSTMAEHGRRPGRGAVPDLGHRASGSSPARVTASTSTSARCGAGIMATAIGDGETQRRSYPAARGQYGTRGWEFVDGARPRGARRAGRVRGARAAHRAAVPERARPR